jgi:hypothetical protein
MLIFLTLLSATILNEVFNKVSRYVQCQCGPSLELYLDIQNKNTTWKSSTSDIHGIALWPFADPRSLLICSIVQS